MTKKKFDQPGTLLINVVQLLKGRNLLDIYTETGLPYFWLRSIASGRVIQPSVNRVQWLYEYLTKTKLLRG